MFIRDLPKTSLVPTQKEDLCVGGRGIKKFHKVVVASRVRALTCFKSAKHVILHTLLQTWAEKMLIEGTLLHTEPMNCFLFLLIIYHTELCYKMANVHFSFDFSKTAFYLFEDKSLVR